LVLDREEGVVVVVVVVVEEEEEEEEEEVVVEEVVVIVMVVIVMVVIVVPPMAPCFRLKGGAVVTVAVCLEPQVLALAVATTATNIVAVAEKARVEEWTMGKEEGRWERREEATGGGVFRGERPRGRMARVERASLLSLRRLAS
jgi:hypothetical protein